MQEVLNQMDPNKTLKKIRELCCKIIQNKHIDEDSDSFILAEMIEDLDGWIESGGFLPDEWKNKE
jgi:hypothetical protein